MCGDFQSLVNAKKNHFSKVRKNDALLFTSHRYLVYAFYWLIQSKNEQILAYVLLQQIICLLK